MTDRDDVQEGQADEAEATGRDGDDANVSFFPAGPYWWTLMQSYAVPELDVEELILNEFGPRAEDALVEVLELDLLDDGGPDLRFVKAADFEAKLSELVYHFVRAYLLSIRDVFTATLGDTLGVKTGTSAGADEWQVGVLNIFPKSDEDLRALAEDIHLALLPYGPTKGSQEEWFGTIADRVKVALTDDLGETLSSPFFRSGEFHPETFALHMTQRAVRSKPFDALATAAAFLQTALDWLDESASGHQVYTKAVEKRTEGYRKAGQTLFEGVVDGLKKAADTLDKDAESEGGKQGAQTGETPSVSIDMRGLVGRLFQQSQAPAGRPTDEDSD